MEIEEIEFKKAVAEFSKIPYVEELKNLIDNDKRAPAKKLKWWSDELAYRHRSDPEDTFKRNVLLWFTITYLKTTKKNIQTQREIINLVMDESIDDKEIRECFDIEYENIRHLVKNNIQSLEELKHIIKNDKSMFRGRRSLDTELRIIANIEKEIEVNNKKEITPYFDSDVSDETLIKIMHLLTKMKPGLNKDTAADLWLYWFNRNPKYDRIVQLNWEGTPAMISNIIQTICKTAKADAIIAAFGVKKVTCSTKKYAKFYWIQEIKQLITKDKQKK